MSWVIKKLESSPSLYLKVTVIGLFAYGTDTNSALKFEDQTSADLFRLILIDATESVEV